MYFEKIDVRIFGVLLWLVCILFCEPIFIKLPFSDCDDLVAPTHGFLSSTSIVHGSHVTVSCNNGYSLSGERTLICLSGSLSGTIGACDAGRLMLLLILKGSTAIQLFWYNIKVLFT